MHRKYSPFRPAKYLWIVLLVMGCASIESFIADPEEESYDPGTIRIIKGTINEVGEGRSTNLDISITSSDNETFTVTVAPLWYLRRININFQEGDVVTVVGSVVDVEDGVIIAQQIRRNRTTLVLRSQSGAPRWAQGNLFNGGPRNSFPGGSTASSPYSRPF